MDIINKGVKINLPYVSLRSAIIHVVDVGNVQLPVSLKVIKHTTYNFLLLFDCWNLSQNAEKLLQKAKPSVSGCGFHRKEDIFRNLSWQIDRTSISIPNSSKFLERNISGWIKLVLSQHQINVQYAEANCSLTRMNLYRSGSHYIRHRHLRQQIGTLIFLHLLSLRFNIVILYKYKGILVLSSCKFLWKMAMKVVNWKSNPR